MYITDTLIKLTAGSKLESDKLYGIKGFECKVEICKSRHAPAGRAINMIYDQTNGFRNDLSMLDYIKACGALKGNGMAYYIDGYDKVKFKLSNFKEKLEDPANIEFKNHFYATAEALMRSSIKESDNFKIAENIQEEQSLKEDMDGE